MEVSGIRKRSRDVDVGELLLSSKRSARSEIADLCTANSVASISATREARRSDDSETLPAQRVDDDCPEIPAHGVASLPDFGSWFSSPSITNLQTSASWSSQSQSRPFELNLAHHTAPLPSLGSSRTGELQHLLAELDTLEQDLLRDLRAARHQYDVRVAELGAADLCAHAVIPSAAPRQASIPTPASAATASVPGFPRVLQPQVWWIRAPQPAAVQVQSARPYAPGGAAVAVKERAALPGRRYYFSSAMPPPAPRPPRNGGGRSLARPPQPPPPAAQPQL